ncbi:MAG: hypothetical protein Q8M65_08800, partial [Rhodoglobus sp.]|nr:hypothetical protein [Rhodoglobus sp.]
PTISGTPTIGTPSRSPNSGTPNAGTPIGTSAPTGPNAGRTDNNKKVLSGQDTPRGVSHYGQKVQKVQKAHRQLAPATGSKYALIRTSTRIANGSFGYWAASVLQGSR